MRVAKLSYSIILLGQLAKHLFPASHSLPHVAGAGDVFYTVGVLLGLILWGFAVVWFVVAVFMIAISGGFPFNMGWWGFIFPIGQLGFSILQIPYVAWLKSHCVFFGQVCSRF